MVSVERWKHHFKRMAGRHNSEDVYIVNQRGRGLGRNSYPNRTLYHVRSQIDPGKGPNPKVEIISPVAQSVDRARALVKGQGGGKKKRKRSSSSSGGKKGGAKKKKKKKNDKKKKQKKKKKKKKGAGSK